MGIDLSERFISLYTDVASGATTLDQGLTIARQLAPSPEVEVAFASMASPIVDVARGGQPETAIVLWRLVLEALDHAPAPRQRDAVAECVMAWLVISTGYLLERPDGRVLADARGRGERVAAQFLDANETLKAAAVLHGVGALLTDPYVERRDPRRFLDQTAVWLARGRAEAMNLGLPGSLEMPEPRTALADAAAILQRAADLQTGRARGQTLRLLADALTFCGAAGGDVDEGRIAAAVAESWELLDPVQDAIALRMIARNATTLGLTLPDRAARIEPHATDVERLKHQEPRTYLHVIASRAASAPDPRTAIDDLLRGLRFAEEISDEEQMIALTAGIAAQAVGLFDLRSLDLDGLRTTEDWTGAHAALVDRGGAEQWPASDRALALLALAVRASKADREDLGVSWLVDALALDVGDVPGVNVAISTGLAHLAGDWAATDFHAERFLEACTRYLNASDMAARVGLSRLAQQHFDRAMETFAVLSDETKPLVIPTAAACLPYLQSDIPGLAGGIFRLWLSLISLAGSAPRHRALAVDAVMAAKGASLAMAQVAHRNRTVLSSPLVQTAIANWRAAGGATTPPSTVAYDEESLLVAHDDTLEQPGRTPAEQLANLSRRLDRTIASELARGSAESQVEQTNAVEICARLPPESVLLSVYPCIDDRGDAAFLAVLAWHDGLIVRRTSIPGHPFLHVGIDGITSTDTSRAVAGLRREVLRDREDDLTRHLELAFFCAFGAVENELRALRQTGYRHLCVNPHGALHFCPLPLLGRGGVPLADDWIVTHVPAVGLLGRQESDASRTRAGTGIFALSFSDARTGLLPLPAAPEEARRIAQAVAGSETFIDRDATIDQFNASLSRHRWIHVATHGRHDPGAPALQHIYLHSGDHHVLPYFAFDVLAHRLDGVDLVTLSACETALGRVDLNDNPRGLQAFLFTAGVATIISCLWPVADKVAALFFERLYAALAGGRSKLQAFAAAQRAVRERYPRSIDWGAFHYSGLW